MDLQRSAPAVDENALALAKAIIPPGRGFGGADAQTIQHTECTLRHLAPDALKPWRALQALLARAARWHTGRPLHELTPEQAQRLIQEWSDHPFFGRALYAVGSLYKATHFDRTDLRGSLRRKLEPVFDPPQRWQRQVLVADHSETPSELECDVVVVGTGAGGGVVGRHLAEQGHAVVFVEEGPLRGRGDFPGHFLGSMEHLYRPVTSLGGPPVTITRGRLVGGSTAVNGGSTILPPRWVTDRWCEDLHSDEFSSEALQPYFETVHRRLSVERVPERLAGPIYELLSSGASRLGWDLQRMPRNAPGCEGKGFCDNGCRTGARQSTDVSYLPGALERGSLLVTQLRIDRLQTEGGAVVGVTGHAVNRSGAPRPRRVSVRAQAVVLAMGALPTPTFLLGHRDKLRLSPALGRHLTLHPSGATLARFGRRMFSEDFVPQSCLSEQFLEDGLLLTSAMPDRHMLPAMVPYTGQKLAEVVDGIDFMGGAGFLAADSTRGRVRRSCKGQPLVTYQPDREDAARVHRGHYRVAELLLASGAEEIYPCMSRAPIIRSRSDLDEFVAHPRPVSDYFLTSFHPLGSCRMSHSPRDGVVDTDHRVHGVPGLYVVDGSTVRGPLLVNPQATIMALATRAAERIGQRID